VFGCGTPARAVLVPGRTVEVAADDTLHRNHLRFLDQHGATGVSRSFFWRQERHLRGVSGYQVMAGLEELEPMQREAGEYAALVRNVLTEDNIERGDSIAGDHEQSTVVDTVELADLARSKVFQRWHEGKSSGTADSQQQEEEADS